MDKHFIDYRSSTLTVATKKSERPNRAFAASAFLVAHPFLAFYIYFREPCTALQAAIFLGPYVTILVGEDTMHKQKIAFYKKWNEL